MAQGIVGIVERLRLGSPGPVLASRFSGLAQDYSARAGSKRLTANVIRDQQRNRITLDERNLAWNQVLESVSTQLVGLRRSVITTIEWYSGGSINVTLFQFLC
jgi:hypothetical protein